MDDAEQKLEAARRILKERELAAEVERAASDARKRERDSQFAVGDEHLRELRRSLISALEGVPNTTNRGSTHSAGSGTLIFGDPQKGPSNVIPPDWDIFAWSPIEIRCGDTGYIWSADLLFASRGNNTAIYEIAFCTPLAAARRHEPFSLDPREVEFSQALGPVISTTRLAYGPIEIASEEQRRHFRQRWGSMFADAILGSLRRPDSMPIDVTG